MPLESVPRPRRGLGSLGKQSVDRLAQRDRVLPALSLRPPRPPEPPALAALAAIVPAAGAAESAVLLYLRDELQALLGLLAAPPASPVLEP